jgi:hypothetical protein
MPTTHKPAPPKYTHYVVSRSANDHYHVLLANNGKIPHNESVTRANKLEESLARYHRAVKDGLVVVVRIKHDAFRKKFPSFARNAGRKTRGKGR